MPPAESITLVERYGSFGLLCVIALATLTALGWAVRYLTRTLVPLVFEHLDRERAERLQIATAHAAEMKKRDDLLQTHHEQTTEILGALVAEVKALAGDGHARDRKPR